MRRCSVRMTSDSLCFLCLAARGRLWRALELTVAKNVRIQFPTPDSHVRGQPWPTVSQPRAISSAIHCDIHMSKLKATQSVWSAHDGENQLPTIIDRSFFSHVVVIVCQQSRVKKSMQVANNFQIIDAGSQVSLVEIPAFLPPNLQSIILHMA